MNKNVKRRRAAGEQKGQSEINHYRKQFNELSQQQTQLLFEVEKAGAYFNSINTKQMAVSQVISYEK